MKARFCLLSVFFAVLTIACQSDKQSLPSHARKVKEKHRVKDSLRTLELIQALESDSLKNDSTGNLQD
ncbi:MAG: hypothetical protein AAF927_07900 [Bacteroidota bacterium]